MLAAEHQGVPPDQRLANFLLSYHTTSHTTTNQTPSALFLQWELRTRLDLVKPTYSDQVACQQSHQLHHHNNMPSFANSQMVKQWWPGIFVLVKSGCLVSLRNVLDPSHTWSHCILERFGLVTLITCTRHPCLGWECNLCGVSICHLYSRPNSSTSRDCWWCTASESNTWGSYLVCNRHPPDRYGLWLFDGEESSVL